MKKIPTYFERDWSGDRSRVVPVVNPACQWVADGEGVATRKLDGTCCMMRRNEMFKRRELRPGDPEPEGFELADFDEETGKRVGWVPVGDGPEDRWFQEARTGADRWTDGTYELIGPKVQGNPEGQRFHLMIRHGGGPAGPIAGVPRDFDGLREWMGRQNIEGVVWHHPDGRRAKLKLRDFGLKRLSTLTAEDRGSSMEGNTNG